MKNIFNLRVKNVTIKATKKDKDGNIIVEDISEPSTKKTGEEK